ncbi:MAG: hypothetical protein IKR33_04775, partial [Bacteroidales bacterium]|nr:hypothetical protein [Bacteroidales bacterium]
QHAWNVQDWQMQANYNSPQAQMQRFRDAGLNPSLIYGQMSEGPSINSTTMPQLQANKAMPFLAQNPVANLDPLVKARLDNIEANTEKTRAEAETENELRVSRKRNLDAATENLFKQNEDIVSRIEQRVHQNSLTDAEVFNISFEQMLKREQISIDWKRLENETNLAEAQIEKLKADRELALAQAKVTEREYDEMVWTFAIRALGLESKVHLDIAMSKQADATAKKLGLESMMIEPQALIRGSASDALKGKAGSVANVGSFVLYSIYDVISNVGRLIH